MLLKYRCNEETETRITRKDIAINKVATPTKMSSYLANGIIPIFSDIIGDFNKVMGKLKYTVPVGQNYEGLEIFKCIIKKFFIKARSCIIL